MTISDLDLGEVVYVSGLIYAGRDAVLPKMVSLVENGQLNELDLDGSVVFHTAVSPAGVGPTSSNKLEIESSIPPLSKAGVKLHLGKGALREETVRALHEHGSAFGIVPPVTALLGSLIKSQRVVAFPEEGMEGFYELEVDRFPVIIAAVHGEALFL